MTRTTSPDPFPDRLWYPDHTAMRAWRMRRYAGRPVRHDRTRALLTIVNNEAVMLPIFLRYYSQFFAPGDTHVLDHGTTDGSTDRDDIVRIPVHHPVHDNEWLREVVVEHHVRLLERYDVVMVVDSDEIVVPDPRCEPPDLGAYLDRVDEPWVSARGWELMHDRTHEAPIDLSRPVLEQRGTWFANPLFDKPVITTGPTPWTVGRHRVVDAPSHLDPDLHLVHIQRMDHDLCWERRRMRRRLGSSATDIATGRSAHTRIDDEDEFGRWFTGDAGLPSIRVVHESVPTRFRSLF